MRFFLSINGLNAGIVFFAITLFLIGDLALSSAKSFGQYFSFDVFVYSFSGSTHWANLLIKHCVPVLIGGLIYVLVARAFLRRTEDDRDDLGAALTSLEPSVRFGIFLSVLIVAWPSIRFPQLLLFEYNFLLVALSAVLFSMSFAVAGLVGVRLGRMIWHPAPVEERMPGSVQIDQWRQSFGPLVAAVLTGFAASLIATLSGS